MSQIYTFRDQAGDIPGIPGTFSHCQVQVEDDGTFAILSPVALAPIDQAQNVVQEQEEAPVAVAEPAPDTQQEV